MTGIRGCDIMKKISFTADHGEMPGNHGLWASTTARIGKSGACRCIHVLNPRENFRELIDTPEDPAEFENRIGAPRYAADLARLRGAIIQHFMEKVLP